jgi:hypothetical protein
MLPILPIDIPTTMRQSLTGARPNDPVLPDRRVGRRPGRRRTPRRARIAARRAATAQEC